MGLLPGCPRVLRTSRSRGKLVVGPPKTRASRRKVSLPLGVMEELADHLRAPGRPTDQVFKAQGGGQLRILAQVSKTRRTEREVDL